MSMEQPFTDDVPFALQRAALRVVLTYDIRGLCDPQYIANIFANELQLGDGETFYTHVNANPTECTHRWRDAPITSTSYPLCPDCIREHAAQVARWQKTAGVAR